MVQRSRGMQRGLWYYILYSHLYLSCLLNVFLVLLNLYHVIRSHLNRQNRRVQLAVVSYAVQKSQAIPPFLTFSH